MKTVTYKALRPAFINQTHLEVGDTIPLIPKVAQFLIADNTLEPVKSATKTAKKEA